MIMALLIDLLLRGGKFFTLAARRTLWQMFENNEYGPRILLDQEHLLKLARATETIHFGKDKDIQTSGKVISLRRDYVRYSLIGDNCNVNPQPEDMHDLKKLETQVDDALKNLDEAMPKKDTDESFDKLLEELERKVREVDADEPVLLPVFMPQKITNKGDSFSSLQGCISKFRIEEREIHEPILQSKPAGRSKYLKASISDDLQIKFGKSRKYFKRITEHFSVNSNHTHNSLPDLTTPTTLSFYTCRSAFHTNSRNMSSGTLWKKPREKYANLEHGAIREMLDKKIKLLAEKKDKRRKKINKSEVKERERLLEVNQRAFKKVEDDLKTIKIINKHAIKREFVDVDELLALLDDNPKINFLKNMKTHKELPCYDTTKSTEFIVQMTSNSVTSNGSIDTSEIIDNFEPKLNLFKLQEEIKANYKQSDSSVKSMVQFMKYEHIPRICHISEKTFGQAISAEVMGYTATKRTRNTLRINREWEKLNHMVLQEEIIMRSAPLKKFTLPNSYENVRTMNTIDENAELEIAAMESTTVLEMGMGVQNELVENLEDEEVLDVKNEAAEEAERAEEVQKLTEQNVQAAAIEQQKKAFRRKMKARKTEEAKMKESVRKLVRPTSVKKLGRKGQKIRRMEDSEASNVRSEVQGKAKTKILGEKADLAEDIKVVDMERLAVKEEIVDALKSIDKIKQQAEEIIVKCVKPANAKNIASVTNAIIQVGEAVSQKKTVEEKSKICETKECGAMKKYIVEQTENVRNENLAECLEKESKTVIKTQAQENQDQTQCKTRKMSEKGICSEKIVKSVPLTESSELETCATEVKQMSATEKMHSERTMQQKVTSSKPEMIQEPIKATSIPIKLKLIKSKEQIPEKEPDFDKIKTDLMQNMLPSSSMAKSRIPVRNKALGDCTEATKTANRAIRKIASQYQVEKRVASTPKSCSVHRKKLRPLQKSGVKVIKSNKTTITDEVDDVEDAPVQLSHKQSVVKEAKDSVSDVFKKLLNKNSNELKLHGKIRTDVSIENEMPPDFDVLQEVDHDDIPMDNDEELEVPARTKNTVVHSEKRLKYCCDNNKEKELRMSYDDQNTEKNARKKTKFNASLKQRRERKRSIQAIREEMDEWTDVGDSAPSEQENQTKHKNLFYTNPTSMRKPLSTPKYTFWNRQPKTEQNTDTDKKEQGNQSKTNQEGHQKKYKMVTNEIDAIGGGKLKVTKLVEDV